MIGLAILIGGALMLGLWQLLGQAATIAIATVALLLVLVGLLSDVWRSINDRRTALRRWAAWSRTDTDSLERALESLDG